MSDKPILFSAPMVRALLAGTKTQTLREITVPTKGQYVRPDMGGWAGTTIGGAGARLADGTPVPEQAAIWNQTTGTTIAMRYAVGDRLWVREHWRTYSTLDDHPPRDITGVRVWYEADEGYKPKSRFRQGMHMPRWASRITLTVTDVRVQRLQEISEEDAKAEGITEHPTLGPHRGPDATFWAAGDGKTDHNARLTPASAYKALWEEINGEGSWDRNPWVAAYTFTVELANIDQVRAA